MELSLTILAFELEKRGYKCQSHIERGDFFKKIQLLPRGAELLDPECLYVSDPAAAYALPRTVSVILCTAEGEEEELSCDYIWPRAIGDVQTLMNLLLSIQHELSQQETRLLSVIAQNGSLQECVEILSEIMENPVYMIDSSFKLLAISSQPHLPLVSLHFRRLIQHGYLPITTVVQLLENEQWKADIEAGVPSVMDHPPFANPFINCKIKTKNKLQAYLFVVQLDRGLSQRDVEIVKQLLHYIKMSVDRELLSVAFQGKYYEHFLHDVITGRITDKQMIREQLQPLKWSPENLFCIAYCPMHTQSPYMMQMLLEDLSGIFDAKPVSFGSSVYCVFSVADMEQYAEVAERLAATLKHYKLTAGLSTAFRGFYHMSKYAHQAELAHSMGYTPRDIGTVYPYSSYAVKHLLSLYEEKSPVECFYPKSMLDLEAYDAAHNTQYSETLYVYLRCERSLVRSAEVLNVHKNTLLHRVGKIQEITGISLENAELRLHLLLSYEMKKYAQAKASAT